MTSDQGEGERILPPPHPSLTSLQDKKHSSQDGALADQTWGDVELFHWRPERNMSCGRLGADCVIRRLVGGGCRGQEVGR